MSEDQVKTKDEEVQNSQENKEADVSESSQGMEKVEKAEGKRQAAHSEAIGKKPQQGQRRSRRQQPKNEGDSDFVEKVLAIKRVAKATKGGTKLSFSALVVVGDGKGRVGFYLGKGNEVAIAIRKALSSAKKNMITVRMNKATIPHEVVGEWCGARVLLKPAGPGTGVIASSAVRAICDGAGIHDILTKCHRSNNAVNVVRATVEALKQLKTKDHYTRLRGKA